MSRYLNLRFENGRQVCENPTALLRELQARRLNLWGRPWLDGDMEVNDDDSSSSGDDSDWGSDDDETDDEAVDDLTWLEDNCGLRIEFNWDSDDGEDEEIEDTYCGSDSEESSDVESESSDGESQSGDDGEMHGERADCDYEDETRSQNGNLENGDDDAELGDGGPDHWDAIIRPESEVGEGNGRVCSEESHIVLRELRSKQWIIL